LVVSARRIELNGVAPRFLGSLVVFLRLCELAGVAEMVADLLLREGKVVLIDRIFRVKFSRFDDRREGILVRFANSGIIFLLFSKLRDAVVEKEKEAVLVVSLRRIELNGVAPRFLGSLVVLLRLCEWAGVAVRVADSQMRKCQIGLQVFSRRLQKNGAFNGRERLLECRELASRILLGLAHWRDMAVEQEEFVIPC